MERTLKNFLQTALLPFGSTMYVYGGGWDEVDNGAGKDARTLGVSLRWREFFEEQDENYDYKDHLYERENGLDCSGYVGWVVYNVMEEETGRPGYVMKARDMAMCFSARGWGSFTEKDKVNDYRPGDIMSGKDHVWISLGRCSDGSVLLLHASPPGVILSGTVTPEEESNSIAAQLAEKYTAMCFPRWHRRYPRSLRGILYLRNYNQMRWHLDGRGVLTDPEGYGIMSGEELIRHFFSERRF